MKCVIMAGGRGTRISSIANDIPKPLIKVCGKPVLEHEIECLKEQGIRDMLITVSYLGNQIIDYFGDGHKISPVTGEEFGVEINYYYEKVPLGNAGALFVPEVRDWLDDDFLLINADSIFCIDFSRLIKHHKEKRALVTLLTHPNTHPYDSGLIIADKNSLVEKWLTKEEERPLYYKNKVNAGIHVINPKVLECVKSDDINGKIDLDRNILRPLAGSGKMYCYDSSEYVSDMGTPDRYKKICADFASGLVEKRKLNNKQKAIFLDRDGTINKYVGFLKDINDFELLPKVIEAIKRINDSGFLAIVVSNQPVIARGEVSESELDEIHNKMETMLGCGGAFLNAIYYCPHHPDKGFKGEVASLKIDCECRKPKPGMLIKAAKDWNIDLSESWMVGDSKNDILAGKNAGCKTALIGNESLNEDLQGESLFDCVLQILFQDRMNQGNGNGIEYLNRHTEKAGRFSVEIDEIKNDYKKFIYSFVNIKPGVVILPFIDGKVFAIRQYRPTIRDWSLELPAGAIEDGETPEQAVERELREEIGCKVLKLIPMGETYASIGCTNEHVFLYTAECEIFGKAECDDSEIIIPEILQFEEFDYLVKRGELKCTTNELVWRKYLEIKNDI